MTKFETTAVFYEYRGNYYERLSAGDDWVTLKTSGESCSDTFPDAIEESADPAGGWIKLPRRAIGSRKTRTVRATWRKLPVRIDQMIETGVNSGRVVVRFNKPNPLNPPHPDFHGNQIDGWWAIVPWEEVDVTDVTWTGPVENPRN